MLSREVVDLASATCMLDPSGNGSARLLGMVDAPEPPEAIEKPADLTSSAHPIQTRAVQVSLLTAPDLHEGVTCSFALGQRLYPQAPSVPFVWCRSCACTS